MHNFADSIDNNNQYMQCIHNKEAYQRALSRTNSQTTAVAIYCIIHMSIYYRGSWHNHSYSVSYIFLYNFFF